MEFTPEELRLMERLRKEERRWPRTRWVLLAMSVFLIIGYGYIAMRLIQVVESESFGESAALFVAFFWPKCLLMFCFATYGIVLATWN